MGATGSVTLTDADWPDHLVEGRRDALRLVCAGIFNQHERGVIASMLPVLRRSADAWDDAETEAVGRLCNQYGVSVTVLFACAALTEKRREYHRNRSARVKAAEPMVVRVSTAGFVYTLYAQPHPTLGVPEISDRGEDGYWSFSAGGTVLCKNRVSLAQGVQQWNDLVKRALYPDVPVLTRGMFENE